MKAIEMDRFISIAKALSDSNRVRALLALEGRELCACQIMELLELAPSTVSKHMSILKLAGLVHGRKEGRWMYYRQSSDSNIRLVQDALRWATEALKHEPIVRNDNIKLKEIIKKHSFELCKT